MTADAMSEYTPTTEQVESAYAYDPEYEYHHPDDPGYHIENRRAFRRWLAAHDRQVQVEAWERGYMFAFAQERGDYTHSRPVPDYIAEDIRSWNPYITEETP